MNDVGNDVHRLLDDIANSASKAEHLRRRMEDENRRAKSKWYAIATYVLSDKVDSEGNRIIASMNKHTQLQDAAEAARRRANAAMLQSDVAAYYECMAEAHRCEAEARLLLHPPKASTRRELIQEKT